MITFNRAKFIVVIFPPVISLFRRQWDIRDYLQIWENKEFHSCAAVLIFKSV